MALIQVLVGGLWLRGSYGGEPISTERPRLGAGPSLSTLSTGKGRQPGCFAVIPRFLVFAWKKQGAQNKVFLNPSGEIPSLPLLVLLWSCSSFSSPQPPQKARHTMQHYHKPGSQFTVTTEPDKRAS